MAYLTIPTRLTEFLGSGLVNSGGYGFTAASAVPGDPRVEAGILTVTFLSKYDLLRRDIMLTPYVMDNYWDYIRQHYHLYLPDMWIGGYGYEDEEECYDHDYYCEYLTCIPPSTGAATKWRYPYKMSYNVWDDYEEEWVHKVREIPATTYPLDLCNEIRMGNNDYKYWDDEAWNWHKNGVFPDAHYYKFNEISDQNGEVSIKRDYIAYIEL